MKKVLCILTLLCAVCTGAWAQETVAGLKVSGTPENGQWSSNTTWYYMAMRWNNAINYLSSGSDYVSGSNLKVNNQTPDRSDYGKWCIVKNGEGYSFYNKAKGTGYAITTSNNKICISETSTPTVYSIPDKKNNQNSVSSWFIRDGVSGNNFWDSRGTHIDHWSSGDAYGNNNGSVYFINAYEDGDKIYLKNKQHEFYIGVRELDNAIEGKASKSDATAWEIKHHEGKIVLKDGSSYMGKVPTTHDTHNSLTSSIDEAEHFSIELNTSGYYVLRLSTSCSSDNNTSHIFLHGVSWSENDGRGINLTTVRWASDANASQWSIEDYTPEGYSEEEINALKAKINDVYVNIYAKTIGYPYYNTADDTPQANLEAVDALYEYIMNEPVSNLNYDNALTALNNVYKLTTINLPKDGKAYYFVNYQMASNTNKTLTGNKYMLAYNAEGTNQLITETYTEGSTTPNENNIFIARKVADNRFVFVTKDGKFLRYYANSSNNNRQGVLSETYSENEGSVLIAKQQLNGGYTQVTLDECFGFVTVQGWRTDKSKNCDIIINGKNGSFSGTDGSIIRYNSADDQYSTAFRIIEVPEGNPNTIKLTNPNKSDEIAKQTLLDKRYVGTFSAPYAVELRDGVEAYTATVDNNVVTFAKLDGNIVPKETGVLLYAPAAESNITQNAVPATTTVAIEEGTNAFVGSNAASVTMVSGYYVLGNASQGVAFYPATENTTLARNKAYLDLSGHTVSAFRFDFETEEQTTAVSSISTLSNTSEAIYDLSGRRCNADFKGIRIAGNKKVIR